MFCQECGKKMADDCLFCPECGTKTDSQPVVQPVEDSQNVEEELTKRCNNCGSPIPADSRFCPECRTKQIGTNDVPQMQSPSRENDQQQHYYQQQNYGYQPNYSTPQNMQLSPEEMEKIKKRNKILGLSVAALIVICVVIVILSSVIKPSINLNKYMTVTAEGYDTVGTALIVFDTERFEIDNEKKLSSVTGKKKASSLNKNRSKEAYFEAMYEELDNSTASGEFIRSVVSGRIDKPDGLSNGDVITYKWDCDDNHALSIYGVKLKYSDIEYTVEGLKEAETFDPFDGLEVSFYGIAPNGRVEINGNPSCREASDFWFDVDRRDGLKVGDKVVVTASLYYVDDIVQYCIENYGKVPRTLSKEYAVSGLDSYIRSIDDVSENGLKAMQAQAEDVFKAKVSSDWGEEETLKGFDYIGNYLLTTKNPDNWGNDNILYLVYKVTVNDKYSNDGKKYYKNNEYYWYISYFDLLVNDLGETTVNVTDYRTVSDRFTIDSQVSSGGWSTKQWYYYGYQSINDLYKVAVTNYIDSYNHEDNVDDSLAPAIELEEVEEEKAGGEEGIIFPNSSEEIIYEYSIEELSDDELRNAINEIYARNGYIFNDESIKEYYEQFDWYEGTVNSNDFSMNLFNEVERKNVDAMQKERNRRK